jgi:hypothetical protein
MTITIAALSADGTKSLSLLHCGSKFFRSPNRYGPNSSPASRFYR